MRDLDKICQHFMQGNTNIGCASWLRITNFFDSNRSEDTGRKNDILNTLGEQSLYMPKWKAVNPYKFILENKDIILTQERSTDRRLVMIKNEQHVSDT